MPGVEVEIERPDEGPPVGQPLSIEISGDDFATLGADRRPASRREIEDVAGLRSLSTDFDLARPEVILDVDRTQAARLGLTTADIAGDRAHRGHRHRGVPLPAGRGGGRGRHHGAPGGGGPQQLSRRPLPARDPHGRRCASPARLDRHPAPGSALTSIQHKDGDRVVTVSGDVTSPDLAEPVRQEAAAPHRGDGRAAARRATRSPSPARARTRTRPRPSCRRPSSTRCCWCSR